MTTEHEWGERCPACGTPWVEDGVQDEPPDYCTACYAPWVPDGTPEDEDTRSPWKRGWDDGVQGISAPPYTPEDRVSIQEWLEGWHQARDSGLHRPDDVNFRRGMDARYRGLPREENASEPWRDGWDHEDQTHKMRNARVQREDSCADELVMTGDLAFLNRAFQAGNRAALLDAMKLCEERCFPPSSWMIEATADLLQETRSETIQYRGRVRDLTRFLAVECLRNKNSPRQWQALTGPAVSLKELAEWLANEGWESDPGYSQSIAIATQRVQRLRDIVDAQSVQKSHAKVKRDIQENGRNSRYLLGIDVAALIRLLGADDFVAEVEATIFDRDFIPFRTDILE